MLNLFAPNILNLGKKKHLHLSLFNYCLFVILKSWII